jgi:3-hydroxy acid dehydrogenase/malonic semialdehyde reductase
MYKPSCVLITGATGDFGKAFAAKFAEMGCALVLHGRDPKKLKTLAAQFSTPVHTICFDIQDAASMQAAITNLPDVFAAIDLLINNAGGAHGLDKFQDSAQQDLDDMIESNVTGLVRMTRLVIDGMVKRQKGHVINIGSGAGNWPYPRGHVYCAVKAFVRQFSLALRADMVGTKVRVTNIEPGMVETQFSLVRFKGDKEKADAVYANTTPLQVEDISNTVVWCACQPPHVNINTVEIMPTTQSFAGLSVERF